MDINIFELGKYILKKWKGLFLLFALGLIVFGLYSYFASVKVINDSNTKNEEVSQEQTIPALKKVDVDKVMNYEVYVKNDERYMESSVFMNLDYLHIPSIDVIFVVDATDTKNANSIKEIYENLISTGLYKYCGEKVEGLDENQICELVKSISSTQEDVNKNNVFRIRVNAKDKEQCESLARAVIEYFNIQKIEVTFLAGEHSIKMIESDYAEIMDISVHRMQIEYNNEIDIWKKNITQWISEFDEQQKIYFDSLKNGTKTDIVKSEPADIIQSPSVSKKITIFGGALFVVLYLCILVVKYVLQGIISSENAIKSVLGIDSLGVVKLKYSNQDKKEIDLALLFNSVKNKLFVENVQGVSLVMLNHDDVKENVLIEIAEYFNSKKVIVNIITNYMSDCEKLEKIEEAESIILVETINESKMASVKSEVELCRRMNTKIIGTLLLR